MVGLWQDCCSYAEGANAQPEQVISAGILKKHENLSRDIWSQRHKNKAIQDSAQRLARDCG